VTFNDVTSLGNDDVIVLRSLMTLPEDDDVIGWNFVLTPRSPCTSPLSLEAGARSLDQDFYHRVKYGDGRRKKREEAGEGRNGQTEKWYNF
jgi:hypothetical protein